MNRTLRAVVFWTAAAAFLDAIAVDHVPASERVCAQAAANLYELAPAQRLADHIRTEREVTAARARLGWHEPAAVERGLGR